MIWANINRFLDFEFGRGEDLWVVGQVFLMFDPILAKVKFIFLFCFQSLMCVEMNWSLMWTKQEAWSTKMQPPVNILSNLVIPAEVRSLPHVPLQIRLTEMRCLLGMTISAFRMFVRLRMMLDDVKPGIAGWQCCLPYWHSVHFGRLLNLWAAEWSCHRLPLFGLILHFWTKIGSS